MKKTVSYMLAGLGAILTSSCSVSRFIPEDGYLLDAVRVESDNREVKTADLQPFLRQSPNAKWFSMTKLPMHLYCASGRDSTKWLNRFLRKIGDAPVVYDEKATEETRSEMQKAVRNMGYMSAQVSVERQVKKKKKMSLRYLIRTGEPYIVRRLIYDVPDLNVRDYLYADSTTTRLQEGMRFNVNLLEEERQRITRYLQDNGFYRFNKDFIVFQADTMRNSRKVDLTFRLLPYQRRKEDAPSEHHQYRLRNVNFLLDTDLSQLVDRGLSGLDSTSWNGFHYYFKQTPFLRPRTLANYNFLRPGHPYSSKDVQLTYASLARLGILKYNNIRFNEVTGSDTAQVDAYITLARRKNKSLSFEVEGTNSAGDLGAAAAVSFTHRNLFKGSETFTVRLRGAYEAVTGLEGYTNDNYVEYGVETSLSFPDFKFPFLSSDFRRRIRATSEVSAKYSSQIRPEFERTLAAAAWSYRWSRRQKATHRLDVLDINYVYMPYTSEVFREYLERMDQVNPLLRHSYEDLLIVRLGYTYTYNSAGGNAVVAAKRNSYSVRVNLEESGNLLWAFSKLVNHHPRYGKAYRLANIDFAQYIRGDFDFTRNLQIDDRNSVVFHAGLGIGYPYGNSKSLPFEKLYFSGGANSVRGWHVRSLGPGGALSTGQGIDYVNHTGDIKLDLNLEYRTFLFWKLNGAAFIDAGNIWNFGDKQGFQPEGTFRFNRFYRQLAVAYGLGIRFDLDFLILRFDGGMKAINPMYSGRDRYPLVHPKLSRDFAFHFAVGYPF